VQGVAAMKDALSCLLALQVQSDISPMILLQSSQPTTVLQNWAVYSGSVTVGVTDVTGARDLRCVKQVCELLLL
jgi:hypothetical protein